MMSFWVVPWSAERDAVEQGAHIAEMRDRHPDLADLAARERMIAVVAGLRRQVEGDRQAGLTLGQVLAIQRIRLRGRRMARIGAENPGLVAHPSPIRPAPAAGLSGVC